MDKKKGFPVIDSMISSGKSILTADQFDLSQLNVILETTRKIEEALTKKRQIPLLGEYILATMFFEPSTRTRLSFESAMHRLGGRVITAVGMQFSSLAKGETLHDTLKVIEGYADVCAIRHPLEGSATKAAKSTTIPVINAGDGAGEHPTQGLLDLYTIATLKPLGERPLRVAFVGDIKYGRTIHSLIKLLSHYPVELVLISPPELALPEKYAARLTEKMIPYEETSDIKALAGCDIAYVTRIQEERFDERREYEKFRDLYVINKELVEKCGNDISIMHPLPRLSEISVDVDDLPNAVYFKQAQNGLYTRMALLLGALDIEFNNA